MRILEILIALLIFGVLIFIHELGHYTAARIFGVGIREFAIGMGPKLLSHTSKKTGIVYALRLFPIGGFVSMVGEDEEVEDEAALNKKPVWQRLIVTAAGAVMNLLLGILLTCILVVTTKNLGTTTILRFADEAALTQASGLQVGDTILKIGHTATHTSYDLMYTIMHDATVPVDVTVRRNGEKMVIKDVVFPTETSEGIVFGDTDFYVAREENMTPGVILKHAFFQSAASIRLIWESLLDLLTGRYGVKQMSGPVGVTSAIGDAVSTGFPNLLSLTALISLNLGIFNLLPLPALDGGRIFFLLVELIRRKPIKPEYEGYIHFAGLVLMLLLMAFVTYQDIMKLFIK